MVDVNATKCKLEYANNDLMKMSDIFLQQLEDDELNDEVENCIDKCIRLKCELDLRHNGQETSEKKDLIFTQIDNALRLPKLADDNHKSMFKLLDSCNEIVRTVKVLGYQIDSLSDVFLVKIIQDKLDKTTRKQWELQNNPRVVPSSKDLMEFLEIHAKSLQNLPNKDANVEDSSIKRETAPRMEVQPKQWGHPGRSPMDYSSKRRPCRICLNRGHAGRFHPENSVVMKSNREFENRAAIIVALRAGRSPKEIVDFLKLPKTTIYRVKKQFVEADSNKEGIATRKKHSRRSDRVRGEEFVKNVKEKIDGNPGKSMRAIAKEMDVGSMTIVRTIHEDLGLKSYALRKGQLLTENMKNNRKGKAAALLNNLKHDSFGMLRFFSDEKNFDVDQKVNPRNDRWICKDPSEIPVVIHTKFPASVMVLGVISSEGDVMPPHFFEKGLRMNADTYINVLETVVKPWMDMVAAGRKYVFQQDSAPAHKAKKTQSWLTLNVPSHWGPDIWPPNSPDCNPLDYYVWGVVERDVNKAPHTTIQSVKKAVHTVMTQMDKVIVAKACASFRTRLETVVANNGNYIE
ncbi:hypothetical protein LAZ67_6001880 [Cordylochernes scorpioides]|uniref:Transposase n=1 Tax=Cordylochernes scorpioides TaxID=51811 RepID=A0ABY6KJE8_9ARAC|nr:hypothetical protein LAZ67_6001880 [Cordylochernes scorpioides]